MHLSVWACMCVLFLCGHACVCCLCVCTRMSVSAPASPPFSLCVCSLCVCSLCVCVLCVCVLSLCVLSLCVLSMCVLSMCVLSLYVCVRARAHVLTCVLHSHCLACKSRVCCTRIAIGWRAKVRLQQFTAESVSHSDALGNPQVATQVCGVIVLSNACCQRQPRVHLLCSCPCSHGLPTT